MKFKPNASGDDPERDHDDNIENRGGFIMEEGDRLEAGDEVSPAPLEQGASGGLEKRHDAPANRDIERETDWIEIKLIH